MEEKYIKLLKEKCGAEGYEKLIALKNPKLHSFVAQYAEHCNPKTVFVCANPPEDYLYIRNQTIKNREEKKLTIEGHTIHFDGYYDQARDKVNTKFLLPPNVNLGVTINSIDKEKGVDEVYGFLKNNMRDKEMYVLFFCLGPVNSEFSISCVQITDSSYVAHSESILYRKGYEQFKQIGDSPDFFRFIHSAGELVNGTSKNIDKRRVYVDIEENIIYSVNTQYAGNTVGLKKLAMRLAINKASKEKWLTEHMFIMGINGKNNRLTYFTGAFPSACGKTSTAMLEDETIVGDDIAYFRNRDGKMFAVNVECGIFGIITNVNSKDDSYIWEVLNTPGEVIFSNVLVTEDKIPYWIGKDGEVPEKGSNHSGEWTIGKKDTKGNEITPSHRNARYTVSINQLKNRDKNADSPEGVEISGIIYGGRDSDISVPVEQAFDWTHGILTKGATLESETTSATLGQEGVRKFNLMSILDFLSVTIGTYINNNLNFGNNLKKVPLVFSVNYFLKDKDGKYMTGMKDKHVWLKWMELRVHNEAGAIKTPTGYIPEYEDLRRLFKETLGKQYKKEDYVKQFTLRIPENTAKIDRIIKTYQTKTNDAPEILFKTLEDQKKRLEETREKFGDYVSPDKLPPHLLLKK